MSLFDLNYYWDLELPSPQVLHDLFPRKSGINGGITLCNVNEFADRQRELLETVDEADDESRDVVQNSFPFGIVGNGAQLCILDARDDGPVVYVEFLGQSCLVIAESFDSFLENWEGVGYLNMLNCPFELPGSTYSSLPSRFIEGSHSGARAYLKALGF